MRHGRLHTYEHARTHTHTPSHCNQEGPTEAPHRPAPHTLSERTMSSVTTTPQKRAAEEMDDMHHSVVSGEKKKKEEEDKEGLVQIAELIAQYNASAFACDDSNMKECAIKLADCIDNSVENIKYVLHNLESDARRSFVSHILTTFYREKAFSFSDCSFLPQMHRAAADAVSCNPRDELNDEIWIDLITDMMQLDAYDTRRLRASLQSACDSETKKKHLVARKFFESTLRYRCFLPTRNVHDDSSGSDFDDDDQPSKLPFVIQSVSLQHYFGPLLDCNTVLSKMTNRPKVYADVIIYFLKHGSEKDASNAISAIFRTGFLEQNDPLLMRDIIAPFVKEEDERAVCIFKQVVDLVSLDALATTFGPIALLANAKNASLISNTVLEYCAGVTSHENVMERLFALDSLPNVLSHMPAFHKCITSDQVEKHTEKLYKADMLPHFASMLRDDKLIWVFDNLVCSDSATSRATHFYKAFYPRLPIEYVRKHLKKLVDSNLVLGLLADTRLELEDALKYIVARPSRLNSSSMEKLFLRFPELSEQSNLNASFYDSLIRIYSKGFNVDNEAHRLILKHLSKNIPSIMESANMHEMLPCLLANNLLSRGDIMHSVENLPYILKSINNFSSEERAATLFESVRRIVTEEDIIQALRRIAWQHSTLHSSWVVEKMFPNNTSAMRAFIG